MKSMPPISKSDPFISIQHLSLKVVERDILIDVSFDIEEEDISLLIGPNGAGKTMLFRTLLGFIQPTSGQIFVRGKPVRNLAESNLRIGYVPQRLLFDRDFPLTVEELLSHTLKQTKATTSIDALLSLVHGGQLIEKPIGTLSGGQWQRILLARALANSPDLLILDEPTAGVDVVGEQSMFDLVHELNHTQHTAVFMASHDLELSSRISNHVICLNQRVICSAAPHIALTDNTLKTLFGMNLGFVHADHAKRHRHD